MMSWPRNAQNGLTDSAPSPPSPYKTLTPPQKS